LQQAGASQRVVGRLYQQIRRSDAGTLDNAPSLKSSIAVILSASSAPAAVQRRAPLRRGFFLVEPLKSR
jgi:hypothetical protein